MQCRTHRSQVRTPCRTPCCTTLATGTSGLCGARVSARLDSPQAMHYAHWPAGRASSTTPRDCTTSATSSRTATDTGGWRAGHGATPSPISLRARDSGACARPDTRADLRARADPSIDNRHGRRLVGPSSFRFSRLRRSRQPHRLGGFGPPIPLGRHRTSRLAIERAGPRGLGQRYTCNGPRAAAAMDGARARPSSSTCWTS